MGFQLVKVRDITDVVAVAVFFRVLVVERLSDQLLYLADRFQDRGIALAATSRRASRASVPHAPS